MENNENIWSFTKNTREANKLDIQNPIEWLKEKFKKFSFGWDNLQGSGIYKEMGWAYDFRPFLTKYVYRAYGHWQECWAINKTHLRQEISPIQKIKILEIK